jgi:hypothetical protein
LTNSSDANDFQSPNETDLLTTNNPPPERTDILHETASSNGSANPAEPSQDASPKPASKVKNDTQEPHKLPERASSFMMQRAIEQRKVRRDQKLKDEMADHYAETSPKSTNRRRLTNDYAISNDSFPTESNIFESDE